MFASPISFRNSVTLSSNLSWPDSMQLACLMVRMRIFLSAPMATAASGTADFLMRLSPGLLLTGTLRCISTFAEADVDMTLGARLGAGADSGGGAAAVFVDAAGIVMVSWHDGHSMSVPAPELSTASSCS